MSETTLGWLVPGIMYAIILGVAFAIEHFTDRAIKATDLVAYVALITALRASWKADRNG